MGFWDSLSTMLEEAARRKAEEREIETRQHQLIHNLDEKIILGVSKRRVRGESEGRRYLGKKKHWYVYYKYECGCLYTFQTNLISARYWKLKKFIQDI